MSLQNLGETGEVTALRYLYKHGYHLIKKNYRCRMGEIDLIVQKNNMIVFVEVKTRSGQGIAAPREWVDAKKQKRIILTAQTFIAAYNCQDTIMRFDVIELLLNEQNIPVIRHLENAFM